MSEEIRKDLKEPFQSLYNIACAEMEKYRPTFNLIAPVCEVPPALVDLATTINCGKRPSPQTWENVLNVFLAQEATALLLQKAANPFWCAHILQHVSEDAQSVPVSLEVVKARLERMGSVTVKALIPLMKKDACELTADELAIAFPIALVMQRPDGTYQFNPLCHLVE